jgi:hypothetical protein
MRHDGPNSAVGFVHHSTTDLTFHIRKRFALPGQAVAKDQ